MRAALIQLNTAWHDPEDNLRKAGQLVSDASSAGATLAVVPEMFLTGFSMSPDAPSGGDSATGSLKAIAKECGINVIAGYALKRGDGDRPENVARVFDSGGDVVATYSKVHPFSYAKEDIHYMAGEGPVVFELDGVPMSAFICYDLRFPELFRAVAREVRLMLVLANWPASRQEHWTALLKARAIENQCFVLGVNRTGRDGNGIEYIGGSAVWTQDDHQVIEPVTVRIPEPHRRAVATGFGDDDEWAVRV